MTIITPPAPLPLRNAKWRLSTPMQVNRSGWTGTSKKVGLPGAQLWSVSGQFVTIISEANAKQWRGFFMSLKGQANYFPVIATENEQVEPSVPNASVRSGANAGSTAPLQDLPVSATVLVAGDMLGIQLPSGFIRLVVLTEPLVTNSSGQGTATFWPELGEVPATGAGVQIKRPFAYMSLTSDPPGWDVDVGQLYSFTLNAEEAR